MSSPESSEAAIAVGSDRVRIENGRPVIEAAEAMDWPVREFCRVPIYFADRKYYVRRRSQAQPPFAARYELWPWPDELRDQSTHAVFYDEDYVTERDEAAKRRRRFDRIHFLLLPFYPLLGLCWSGFKNRVLQPVGFEPRSITWASVVMIFNLWIVEGIFVGWLRGGLLIWWFGSGNLRSADGLLLVVLTLDTTWRANQLLKSDVQEHLGFCEWLWPRRRS
jgi:hypothetical protein